MFGIFSREGIISMLLSLPIVLIALSIHEAAHAYVANKLGDPTAKNFGRVTLNPIKHIDPVGLLCMLIARVGWAKPVPINARNFKNPRRDMAISAAAGPISNLLLGLICFILLRIVMFFMAGSMQRELYNMVLALNDYAVEVSTLATVLSFVAYFLYLGTFLNISLAIFNLLPIPPFDGSRVAYVFLPTNLYFSVMKYERYIQIVLLVLFALGVLSGPVSWVVESILGGLSFISGMPEMELNVVIIYLQNIIFG